MARAGNFDGPAPMPGDPRPKQTKGRNALEGLANFVKGKKKLEPKDEEEGKWDEHYRDTLDIDGKPKPEVFDLTSEIKEENPKKTFGERFNDLTESVKSAFERKKTIDRVTDGMEKGIDAKAMLKGIPENVYKGWKFLGDLNLYNDYLKRAEQGKAPGLVEKALFGKLLEKHGGAYTKTQLQEYLNGHFTESVILKFLSVRSCIGFGLMGAGGIFAALSGAMEGATHSKKVIDAVRGGFRATGAVIATHDVKKAYDNQWVIETTDFLQLKQQMDDRTEYLQMNNVSDSDIKAEIDKKLHTHFREKAEIKGVGLIAMAKDAAISASKNIAVKVKENLTGEKREETDQEKKKKVEKYNADINKNADKMYKQYQERVGKIEDPNEMAKLLVELNAVARQWKVGEDEKTADTAVKVQEVTEKGFDALPFEVRSTLSGLDKAVDKKLAQRHLQHWGAVVGVGTAAFFAPEISKFLGGKIHEGLEFIAGKIGSGGHEEVVSNPNVFASLKEQHAELRAKYENNVLHGKPGRSGFSDDGKHVFTYTIDKNGQVIDTTKEHTNDILKSGKIPVSQKEFEAILNGERIPRTIGVPHVEATPKGAGKELLYSVGKRAPLPKVLDDIYKENPKAFGGKKPNDVLRELARQQAPFDKRPKTAFNKLFKQFTAAEVSSGTRISWTGRPEDPIQFETPKQGTPPSVEPTPRTDITPTPAPTPTPEATKTPFHAAVASGSNEVQPLKPEDIRNVTFKEMSGGMYEGSNGKVYSIEEKTLIEASQHQGEHFISAVRPSPSPSPEHTPTPAPTPTPEATPIPRPTETPLRAAVASGSPTPSPTPDVSGRGWGTGREFTGMNPEVSNAEPKPKGLAAIGNAFQSWWHDLTRDRVSGTTPDGRGFGTGATYKGVNPDYPEHMSSGVSGSAETPKPKGLSGAEQLVRPTAGFPGETDHSAPDHSGWGTGRTHTGLNPDFAQQSDIFPDGRGWGTGATYKGPNPDYDGSADFPDGRGWGTGRTHTGPNPDAPGNEAWHEEQKVVLKPEVKAPVTQTDIDKAAKAVEDAQKASDVTQKKLEALRKGGKGDKDILEQIQKEKSDALRRAKESLRGLQEAAKDQAATDKNIYDPQAPVEKPTIDPELVKIAAAAEQKYGSTIKGFAEQLGKTNTIDLGKTPARTFMNIERLWSVSKLKEGTPEFNAFDKQVQDVHEHAIAHLKEKGVQSIDFDGKKNIREAIAEAFSKNPKAFGGKNEAQVLVDIGKQYGFEPPVQPTDPAQNSDYISAIQKHTAELQQKIGDIKMPNGQHLYYSVNKEDIAQVSGEHKTLKSFLGQEEYRPPVRTVSPQQEGAVVRVDDTVRPAAPIEAKVAAAAEAKAAAGKIAVAQSAVETKGVGKSVAREAESEVKGKSPVKQVETPAPKPETSKPMLDIDKKTGHQMLHFVTEQRGKETLDISVEGAKNWDIHSFTQAFDAFKEVKGNFQMQQQLLLALETATKSEEGAEYFINVLGEHMSGKEAFWDVEDTTGKDWLGNPTKQWLPGKGREILKEALMAGGHEKKGTAVAEVMRFLYDKVDVKVPLPKGGELTLDHKIFETPKVPETKPPSGDFKIESQSNAPEGSQVGHVDSYVKMFDRIKDLGDGKGGASFALLTSEMHENPSKGMTIVEAIAKERDIGIYSGKGEELVAERKFMETVLADKQYGLENARKMTEVLLHPETANTAETAVRLRLSEDNHDVTFYVNYKK